MLLSFSQARSFTKLQISNGVKYVNNFCQVNDHSGFLWDLKFNVTKD